jgi:hypothetical protein
VDEAFYKEQIARLQRDKEELRAEIERLRKLLEEAQRSAKRQAAPFSGATPKPTPLLRDGRKASATVNIVGGRFRHRLMKLWKYLCRNNVRNAAGA